MADGINEIAEGLQNARIDDDSEIQQIIDENNVHTDWKCFILEDESIKNGLNEAVTFLNKYDGEYIPDRKKNLRAFHRDFECPSKIKAVILGHDPIPDTGLATGLAFSFPDGMTEGDLSGYTEESVLKVNNAIRKALEDHTYSYENGSSLCNEYLAKNGILLLNTALTVGSEDKPRRLEHFQEWKDFTFSLLKKLLSRNEDLFILCWGTNAEKIGKRLQGKSSENNIMMNCHHPTFPRNNNNFDTEAPKQFKKILKKHPNIFKRQQ